MIRTLAAVSWVVLSALLLPGCSEQPVVQTRPRGLLPGEETSHARLEPPRKPAPVAPAPPPPPRSQLASPFAKAADPGALASPQALGAAAASADAGSTAVPATDAPTPPRDLPSELIALLGQPASCLDLAAIAAAGGRTTISITAQVMPSGRVTRASASAPNQLGDALRCLEDRATAKSFRGPVPGAPREVTATIPIEVVAQPGQR